MGSTAVKQIARQPGDAPEPAVNPKLCHLRLAQTWETPGCFTARSPCRPPREVRTIDTETIGLMVYCGRTHMNWNMTTKLRVDHAGGIVLLPKPNKTGQ